jgi:murein DD-endopeptidase MepM/ murein hydrolase activator NlpD
MAGNSGGYGNMVEIDHGKGITTRYGHMSAILVKVGDRIETDDIIGRAGSTGRSTGPHIHYEVRRNDQAIDPIRFLTAGSKLKTYLN